MSSQANSIPVLSKTLIEIYNAAIDPVVWFDAIDRCVSHVGAASSSLMSIDSLNPSAYSLNIISHHIRENATDEKLNYWLTELSKYDGEGHQIALRYPALTVYDDLDIWPDDDQLDQRPDFVFLRGELGIRRKLAARLSDNKRYINAIGFHFPAVWEKPSADTYKKVSGVVPHVAKAVEMGNLYNRLQNQYAAVLSAIDHVGIGLCVLQSDGYVIVTNLEAKRILESGHGIEQSKENRLVCISAEHAGQLDASIREAAMSNPITAAERILSLRKGTDANPLIIEVSPLSDHLQELNASTDTVLVQLIDVDCHHHCSANAFVKVFGLTAAEGAVTKLLLQGLTNREIADARSTSTETVKSQVRSIMVKAGVTSRVRLIRLVLKTEPPVGIRNVSQ